jgi:hypothetical protein
VVCGEFCGGAEDFSLAIIPNHPQITQIKNQSA